VIQGSSTWAHQGDRGATANGGLKVLGFSDPADGGWWRNSSRFVFDAAGGSRRDRDQTPTVRGGTDWRSALAAAVIADGAIAD